MELIEINHECKSFLAKLIQKEIHELEDAFFQKKKIEFIKELIEIRNSL